MGLWYHSYSCWLQTLFAEKKKSKRSPTLSEQCYPSVPRSLFVRKYKPDYFHVWILSYPAISGYPSGQPIKMSSGTAVDPVAALLLVAAKKVNQSDMFSGDGWANEKFLRYSSGLEKVCETVFIPVGLHFPTLEMTRPSSKDLLNQFPQFKPSD